MASASAIADSEPVALELCDAGLLAYSTAGRLAPPSPGYAVVDGAAIDTGRKGRSRARLTPRRAHHRFWQELDGATLPRPFPRRWTHADLVHRHLTDLRLELAARPERVIAVAPGDFGPRRLGLFLGVAAAAGWPVAGLIDAAVAAASTLEVRADRAWHLDLGLHRALASELALGSAAARRRVLVEPEAGLISLERCWARFFAAAFVRATRYDPLHSAESEQRLYLEMGDWLDRLSRDERCELEFHAGGRRHAVEISRREAVAAAGELYDRLAALLPPAAREGSSTLLLSSRCHRLPGLADRLAAATGHPPVALLEEAPAAGALAHAGEILSLDEAPPFVVRLAGRDRGAA